MSASTRSNRRLFWVAILIPILLLGGSLGLLLAYFQEQLAFTSDEQVGVRYVGAVQEVVLDLQKVRGLSHIDARLGEPSDDRVHRLQRRIHRRLARLEGMEGARFPGFTELIRRAHRALHRQFVEGSPGQDPDTRFAGYTAQVERLQRVMHWVADRSRLVLDPERRTYYLMRLYVEEIPALIEALGRLRGLRSGLLVDPRNGGTAGERVQARVAAARAELEGTVRTFGVLGFFEPELQDGLARRTRRLESDTRTFLGTSRSLPERIASGATARGYFDRATVLIDRWAGLNEAIQGRLNAGLKARRARLGVDRFLGAAGIGAAILAMIAVFTVSFRREARFRERLRQETDLSAALLQGLPGLFFLMDRDLRLVQWNGRFRRLTGYPGEALHRRRLAMLFDPDERTRVEAALHEGLSQGYCELDAQLVTRDQGHLWFHITGSRVILQGETHLVGFAVDIGERKRMEGELRRLAFTDALTGLYN
ncbi:MAG TPA: PAS domain-containing protein, partial [Gammaproteobacteria bacterium]|nr:PAS domain-containing protein [Gammaproteobacteria bacterium]